MLIIRENRYVLVNQKIYSKKEIPKTENKMKKNTKILIISVLLIAFYLFKNLLAEKYDCGNLYK
jgi:hypothetical protein